MVRTRLRVRMDGNDITLRDVIYVYVVGQIERNKDARFGIHEKSLAYIAGLFFSSR